MTRQSVTQANQQGAEPVSLSRGGILQRKCDNCGQHKFVGNACKACQNSNSLFQRPIEKKADFLRGDPNLAIKGTSEHPLDRETRALMESRFSHDFSKVRVRVEPQMAQLLNAKAYTVDNRITFGKQFSTQSPDDQKLLAHELAHVVQQSRGGAKPSSSAFSQHLERDADQAANVAIDGVDPVAVREGSGIGLVRQQVSPENDETVSQLSDEELEIEILLIRQWLFENPVSSEEREIAESRLVLLEANASDRNAQAAKSATPSEKEEGSGIIIGALLGEFEKDQSFGAIALDTVLGLIPIVDTGLDIRDIIAHVYWMIAHGEYNQVMRWVGAVITLIGVIPEIGSVIKGVIKSIIKGVSHLLGHVGELVAPLGKLLPRSPSSIGDTIAELRILINGKWQEWVNFGTKKWNESIDTFEKVLERLKNLLSEKWSHTLTQLQTIKKQTPPMLSDAFKRLKEKINKILDELGQVIDRAGEKLFGEFHVNQPLGAIPGGGSIRHSDAQMSSIKPDLQSSIPSRNKSSSGRQTEIDKSEFTSEEILEDHAEKVSRIDLDKIELHRVSEDVPLELSPDMFKSRFAEQVSGIEKHHSFFKYLLGAISRARNERKIPRHTKLLKLEKSVHQALHDLFDTLYPHLKRREGAAQEISESIKRGTITPGELADLLLDFYKMIHQKSPEMLSADELQVVEKVIESIRRRGQI